MPALAVAAVSARLLAEAAARDGYTVVALDCFGDADTRRASAAWHAIGRAGQPLHIDGVRALAALRQVAARGDAIGWIAGSGFEAEPECLAQGAAVLPLLGSAPAALRRLRAPSALFDRLDALAIAHPETRLDPPQGHAGWLRKDAGGHGGWQVRRLTEAEHDLPVAGRYYQREIPGTPMSASFIANRREARVLGFNRLRVRAFGARPFVYAGAVGPLPLPPRAARAVVDALQALVREFEIAGLGSLDFLLDGDAASVLELNARPSASMALYGDGWLRAHVRACVDGELPDATPDAAHAAAGHEILYAERPLQLSAAAAKALEAVPHCHDRPAAGMRFAIGDPLCSHSARAADEAQLESRLAAQRTALRRILEIS
jgi:predicted ATP-grasp superfamily ATP-dependent carboligase